MRVRNAKIVLIDIVRESENSKPYLALTLVGFGWGCVFSTTEFADILHILDTFEINRLSELENSYCRALIDDGIVRDIGHILEDSLTGDKWLRHWFAKNNNTLDETSDQD